MSSISGRQHLVPGLLDLSEDEIAPETRRIDPYFVLTGVVVFLCFALLFWATG
jgi:hypothetical protein